MDPPLAFLTLPAIVSEFILVSYSSFVPNEQRLSDGLILALGLMQFVVRLDVGSVRL
jgi:hypothetical protein